LLALAEVPPNIQGPPSAHFQSHLTSNAGLGAAPEVPIGAHEQEQAREAVSASRTACGRALGSRVLCVPLVVPVRKPNAAPER